MRIRLLVFKKKLDVNDFVDKLNANEVEGKDKKISFYQIGEQGFKSNYTEVFKYKSFVVNSLGEEEEVELVQRVSFDFNVYSRGEYFIFIIFDSPRSISSFVDEIYSICVGRIFHKEVSLDLRDFYKFIEKDTGYFIYKIPSIQVSDVSLNNSSSAIIKVASSKNSIIDLEKFLDGRKYALRKLTFHCNFEVFSSAVEATSTGLFKMSFETFEVLEYKLVNYVFSAL